MKLETNQSIQIRKPIEAVFEGIVNPDHITQYFISESSGRLESGKELKWKFPEFPDWYPVRQIKVEKNLLIQFVWDPDTIVQISLKPVDQNSTLVNVKEGSKELNEVNLKWVLSNTGGWANFLACLKAYLEYGVNLRKGAYDFMKK